MGIKEIMERPFQRLPRLQVFYLQEGFVFIQIRNDLY